ncbi:MAG: SAM-dependent chlorinase/fluorinase [Desulfobaccales bacterium]
MHPRAIITLLSDFGNLDPYAATMKGVILSLNPEVTLVDLTHDVPPQDIVTGAFLLAETAPYFPPGTIHLAVVDPGVGTNRRAMAARAREQFWVGPDNGLFHLVFQEAEDLDLVSLEDSRFFRESLSHTFHGRDIFAPVAAHLSLGTPLHTFGPPLADPATLPWPEPSFAPEAVRGEIIYIDGFGNLVSNIRIVELMTWLGEKQPVVILSSLTLRGLARTYGDAGAGEFLALVGSHGYLEIACAQGNAARRLSADKGRPLAVFLA